MKKKNYIISSLILLVTLLTVFAFAGCRKKEVSSETPESTVQPDLPALEFVEKEIEMLCGESRQLSVATLQAGETITYSSNDVNVVTVDANGLIKGVGVGTTVVKAVTSQERTALTQITVHDPEFYPVPYIAVDKSDVCLSVGDEYVVNYVYTYRGEELDSAVQMSSENQSVATVTNGVISAVGVGTTNITLTGVSNYGTATTSIQVSVIERQVEFSLSISGRDIYAGRDEELIVYVNESDGVKEIDGASFTISDTSVATISGNVLTPQKGGDATVSTAFSYGGKSYTLTLDIHVYGMHTCTIKLQDGSTDSVIEGVYGDTISLKLKNEDGNPEYTRQIKSWILDGEEIAGNSFVMPDKDVEVLAKFVNETEENFVESFTAGHLLNDIRANAVYEESIVTDSNGVSSDFGGHVKFTSPNWSSLNFYFDEDVVVNEFSSVRMKIYLPNDAALLYFGYASEDKWSSSVSTRRYEAGRDSSGEVPHKTLEYNKWVILEMPLSAFKDVGEKLDGISICVSSNSYILIDYISVNLGLAMTDPIYQDKTLYKAIISAENGSLEQAHAIKEYYVWSQLLTDAERLSSVHVENVASIKVIMTEHFDSAVVLSDANIPTVTGNTNYTGDQAGTANCHTEYKSREYDHYYMTQFNSGLYDGKFTLNAYNYNSFSEVSFGLYAIASLNGTITIGGESTSFDNTKEHYYKVVISDGVLTLYDDSVGNNDGGGVVFTVNLSEDVLNGKEKLVIDFEFDGWSQGEITEMYMTISLDDII